MRIAIFLSVGLMSLWACAQSESTKMPAKDAAMNRVELIDFYGTHRCVTCEAIEANARYTVEHFFADAVKEGRLSFITINVDEEKNYDMAEKFEATGTALFINVIKNGREQHFDLTNFAFEKGKDRDAFSKELKSRLEEQLGAL